MSARVRGTSSFVRAVEARLESILRRPIVLSPRDWTTLASWHAQGIPLPLILETLDEVAAKKGGAYPRSLRYFVRAVEESWQAVVDGRAIRHRGAEGSEPQRAESPETPWGAPTGSIARPPAVERLLEELSEALARGAERATVDERLDRALAAGSVAPDLLRAAREAALEALREYRDRMPADAWEKTLDRAVVERLRRALGLPRLRSVRPMV